MPVLPAPAGVGEPRRRACPEPRRRVAAALLARPNDITGGRLGVDVPVHAWHAIKTAAVQTTPAQIDAAFEKLKKSSAQSKSIPDPKNPIKTQIRKTP